MAPEELEPPLEELELLEEELVLPPEELELLEEELLDEEPDELPEDEELLELAGGRTMANGLVSEPPQPVSRAASSTIAESGAAEELQHPDRRDQRTLVEIFLVMICPHLLYLSKSIDARRREMQLHRRGSTFGQRYCGIDRHKNQRQSKWSSFANLPDWLSLLICGATCNISPEDHCDTAVSLFLVASAVWRRAQNLLAELLRHYCLIIISADECCVALRAKSPGGIIETLPSHYFF